jgi:hypothetical protein
MRTEVDQKHIDALGQELRQILTSELAAGNRVVETRSASPASSSIFVLLANSFNVSLLRKFPGLQYREFKNPMFWSAHYRDVAREQILACGFD